MEKKKNKKKQQRSARRKWTRGGRKEGVALSPPAPGGAVPSAPRGRGLCPRPPGCTGLITFLP